VLGVTRTKAAVYARISSDPHDTALGVTRQTKDCQELTARRGWDVHRVYVDNDVSATSGKPRPQYLEMMAALRAGQMTALVCWDVDRLTRSPRELEDVVDLPEQHGVALASVGGDIDLATPQGRLTARIKGSVARHESEQLARRIRRKMTERAEAGAPAPHGRVAYGWRREYQHDEAGRVVGSRDVVDDAAARVVRDAAAAVLAGESIRAITARLAAADAPRPTSQPWSTSTLRNLLMRERNTGLIVHQGQVIGRGNWQPILDEDTHQRLRAVLCDPARRTTPASSAVKYLLSGLARCGVCGGPMRVLVAGKDGRQQDAYCCQHGYHVRRMRPPLDDLVTRIVITRLARPDAAGLFTRPDDDTARQAREQAEATRARLDLAADSYAAGDIDARQLARITTRLRPELDRHEQAARDASSAPDLLDLAAPDIAERWEGLPLGRKRAVIDLLLDIQVMPTSSKGGTPTFDPASVRIHWKAA